MTTNQLSVFPTEPILDVSPVLETTPANKSGLPTNWQWVKLGDVVNKIFDGPFGSNLKTVDYIDEPGYQVIRLENIGYMEFIGHKVTFISEQKFAFLEKHEIYEGDIVFSSFIGDTVRTTVVPKLKYRAINKADCFCIRINPDKVDRHFIVYALSRQETQKVISLGVHGATRPRINTTFLKSFKLPLPPLAEQQRIVAKIEELFSEIDAGVREVEAAIQRLKIYRQAVLHYFFSDLNARHGSEVITHFVSKVKHSLKAGPFGSALKKEYYVDKGYKIYGQEQVIKGDPSYGDYYINEEKYQSLSSCKIQPGDVLISLVGTVGKILVLPSDVEPGIINPRLIKITFDRSRMNPHFFKYYFESGYLKNQYSLKTHGATMNILSLSILKELPFPKCPIDEQTQVVQEIEARLSQADALEKTLRTELLRAERLRQSVLKQAFTGKLLKTDVPASLPA